jgi:hypothetical protein
MASSPPSSPDLHPPSYLQPSSSSKAATPVHSPRSVKSPSSLFLPPPAITTLTYTPSKSTHDLQRSPLQQLDNQSRRLTVELQDLLDTQSAALMGTAAAAAVTTSTASAAATRKERAPSTLSAARNGILTAMSELSSVKSRQAQLYRALGDERTELLATLSTRTSTTQRLRRELRKIDRSPEAKELELLGVEAREADEEMDALRLRLRDLENRRSELGTRIAQLDNVVAAKSCSYKATLESVSARTSTFLKERGQPSPEAAVETWSLETEAFTEKEAAAEKEREALDDGMKLWAQAMEAVCAFENAIRRRMGDGLIAGEADKAEVRKELDTVVGGLEKMVDKADKEGWKLLIVAIGAELQAFREAGEVLKRSLLASNHATPQVGHVLDDHRGSTLLNIEDDEDERRLYDYSPLDN